MLKRAFRGSFIPKFYAIGFLLLLIILLDLYVYSLAFSTGLGRDIRVSRNPLDSFHFEEGKSYEYEFLTNGGGGNIKIRVIRNLDGNFLMKGSIINRIEHGIFKGSSSREELFIVDSSTGTSPGVNYFSGIWNHCSNVFLYLSEERGATDSSCQISIGGTEDFSDEVETFGWIRGAKAASKSPSILNTKIRMKAVYEDKEKLDLAVAEAIQYLNITIALFLGYEFFQRIIRDKLAPPKNRGHLNH